MKKTNEPRSREIRRQLLRAGVALAATSAAGHAVIAGAQSLSLEPTIDDVTMIPLLPEPSQSGIDHVVVVTMENRSFDHYLGWVPGANGRQAGLSYPDAFGNLRQTFPLASDPAYGYQGCGHADPDHSFVGGRTQFNGGRCDGWLLTPDTNKTNGDLLPVGYYTPNDLPFFAACAQNWTICDNYMPGILSETYPNRFYLLSGETDRLVNDSTISQLPSIFDRFNAKGIPARYYYSDIPFTALYGTRMLANSFPFTNFLADAAAGNLPALSFIDPRFAGEGQGTSGDDHPVSDIRNGQAFLNRVYDAVRTGPAWETTLLIILYDEWGGFFDHVPPIVRPVSYNEQALGNDGRLGFRVPLVLLGPRVKRRNVSSRQFDPSSLHSFLMWRFGIEPLGVRSTDKKTNNIAYALDFKNPPNLAAPAFNVPPGPFGGPCSASGTGNPSLEALAPLAQSLGFKLL
ncbi:alkaline phosphatase family protein [Noviherbaspirillum pedocola]|uniref:phospholipase C n=1 Tax=Noviherbaspirillum pedocola TaxID=2801341 RepID=A0A934SXR1_9BURK|nr:alkaline phosphatase family protein [Noviherbaspirillum pedocola]MBK4737270.1 alkaline phosphatase family protein [Noviherbaspirillum pedocola]